jgi:hypothetical protein
MNILQQTYAKLVDVLTIEEAPSNKDGVVGFNHNADLCKAAGYKHVNFVADVDGTWKTYAEIDTAIQEANFTYNNDTYKARVIELIRAQYSADDEQAILRKKLAGIDEATFVAFNAYCEACKKTAKLEQINQ